ncbi:alpha/beta fold hydrolase [Aliiroseovarius sp. 2305UL8-7]|uniref:alpha/beta hydrolase family protein n=1 Tax=Aliiroseovarius conchicola TaxID=3121637 RepID=UPI003527DF6C
MEETVHIDGPAPLTGTYYSAQNPRAFAVLNGATGVPHRFYRHFARWLAEHRNVSCLVYDYRGFGASADRPVKDVTATMLDWGLHDAQAAREWVEARAQGAPLWLMGHSLGGLLLARQDRPERIDRVVTICSGPVHTTDHPWPFQALARTLWFIAGPLSISLFGYVPKQLSGLGTDIPGPVFRQWKHWCTTPGFTKSDPLVPAAPLGAITAPLRFISVSDDPSVPPVAVDRLRELYPGTPVEHLTIDPADHKLGPIGHTDIFRRKNSAVWSLIVD